MATIVYTKTGLHGGGWLIIWTGLLLGDDGEPFAASHFVEANVQVVGTFAGATLLLEGANLLARPAVAADYSLLGNPGQAPLRIFEASLNRIEQGPMWIRPRVDGGDGTTNLTVRVRVFKRSGWRHDL